MFYIKCGYMETKRECNAFAVHSPFSFSDSMKTLPSIPAQNSSLLTAKTLLGSGFSVPGFAAVKEYAPEIHTVRDCEYSGFLSVEAPLLRSSIEIHLKPEILQSGETFSTPVQTFFEPVQDILKFNSGYADGFSCTVVNQSFCGMNNPSMPRKAQVFRMVKKDAANTGRFICIKNRHLNL